MGPVAYVADAVIVRIADALGLGAETAFRLVRLFGVLQLAALVVVLGALMARVISQVGGITCGSCHHRAEPDAADDVGECPERLPRPLARRNRAHSRCCLTPTIVLGPGAALVHRRSCGRGGVDQAHGLGRRRVASPVGSCGSTGAGRSQPVVAFLGGTLAVCGWWFVRNVVLYGDPTAASAVARTGVSFDRYRLAQPW